MRFLLKTSNFNPIAQIEEEGRRTGFPFRSDFMESKNRRPSDRKANKLIEKIIKHFLKYHVAIDIPSWYYKNNRFFFEVKMKGSTREKRIFDIAPEIRMKLKFPVFFVHKDGLDLYLIVSESEVCSLHLYDFLHLQKNRALLREMKLPYIVGRDVTGKVIVEDLAEMPHLLLGGSSNSGKSTGLRAMITCIANIKSPSQVNFILVDVGANDLMIFSDLPHFQPCRAAGLPCASPAFSAQIIHETSQLKFYRFMLYCMQEQQHTTEHVVTSGKRSPYPEHLFMPSSFISTNN